MQEANGLIRLVLLDSPQRQLQARMGFIPGHTKVHQPTQLKHDQSLNSFPLNRQNFALLLRKG